MENNDLIRRAEDLAARAARSGSITHTGFLSPAERYQLETWAKRSGARLLQMMDMAIMKRIVFCCYTCSRAIAHSTTFSGVFAGIYNMSQKPAGYDMM